MFYHSTLNTQDQESIVKEFYPAFDYQSNNTSNNFRIKYPLQMVFESMKSDLSDGYYNLTYINTRHSMYSSMTVAEATVALSSLEAHKHDFIEFMYVIDGEIYINIENSRHLYTKGSCYIINRNVMHMEEYASDNRIVFLQIKTDLLQSILNDLELQLFDVERLRETSDLISFLNGCLTDNVTDKDYLDFVPLEEKEALSGKVHNLFDELTREMLMPEVGSSLRIKHLLITLFHLLSNKEFYSTVPVRIGTDLEYNIYSRITESMSATKGKISRSQLAETLNYSGSYLNEISKKYSGLSLFNLSMTFCMKEAARLLTETTDNIADIGFALGFSNRTHFYKIFKDIYGCTPAQYRRNH